MNKTSDWTIPLSFIPVFVSLENYGIFFLTSTWGWRLQQSGTRRSCYIALLLLLNIVCISQLLCWIFQRQWFSCPTYRQGSEEVTPLRARSSSNPNSFSALQKTGLIQVNTDFLIFFTIFFSAEDDLKFEDPPSFLTSQIERIFWWADLFQCFDIFHIEGVCPPEFGR